MILAALIPLNILCHFDMLFLTRITFCGLLVSSVGIGNLDESFQNFKLVWCNISNYDDYVDFGKYNLG